MAQARAGFLPASLGAIHRRHGSPTRAVIFVAVCTGIGACPGQVPVEWIVTGAWAAVGILFWRRRGLRR